MSKTKTTVVTALVAVMLAAIIVGLYHLAHSAFVTVAGAFACVGYGVSMWAFCRWISGGTTERAGMLPPVVKAKETARDDKPVGFDDVWKPDEAWTGDYDAIRAEVKGSAV